MEFSSASIRWSAHYCFVSSICLPRDDRGGLIVNQYRRLSPVACVAPCVFGDSRPKSLGRSELPCRRQGGIARRQGAATWRDRRSFWAAQGRFPGYAGAYRRRIICTCGHYTGCSGHFPGSARGITAATRPNEQTSGLLACGHFSVFSIQSANAASSRSLISPHSVDDAASVPSGPTK
jgi:hypothetical protein